MRKDYAVVSMTAEAKSRIRRTGVMLALAPLWVCVFGVLMLTDFMGMFGELSTPMTVAAIWCLLSPVMIGFALQRIFRLAFGSPTLVSGSDTVDGIVLTQRQGRGRGASVLVPHGSRVVLSVVKIPTKDSQPVSYGVSVAADIEGTVMDLQVQQPDAFDLSPAIEHLSSRGMHVTVNDSLDAVEQ